MENKPLASRSIINQFSRHYLFASIIPIIFLLILILAGVELTRNYLAGLMTQSTRDLNLDAERSLQQLGEEIIMAKAKDVARQIEMYFRAHPDKTFAQMRKDPLFMGLAIQKVGKTGYTALTEVNTWMFLVHPNAKLHDTDMRPLAKKMPDWWKIVQRAVEAEATESGYYNWREPDSSFRKKFMVVTPVGVKHKGITIWVSATTYIDEFSVPVLNMRKKSEAIVDSFKQYETRQLIRFSMFAGLTLLLTFVGIYFWGRRVGLSYIVPITQLAETAKHLGEGKWEAHLPDHVLQRKDEIGVMAQSFSRMSGQLKETFSNLEQRMTELRQTRDALKASEEHYRSLFDGIPIGLYRSSPEGNFLDVNPVAAQSLGYPDRATLLSTNITELYFHPDERAAWMARMRESGGTQANEVRLRKHDGSPVWMENSSRTVYDESGAVLYYEGSLKDTTERRLAEAALKESEENFKALYEESQRIQEVYRSLINSSADAIVTCDLNERVTYVSPMFTTIFGWRSEELIGKSLPLDPEPEKEASRAAIGKVTENGTPCHDFQTRRTTKDGQIIDVSISASRYNDHAGKPAGILIILRDISAAKRMEEHLQQVERLEAIATLAGGIAHDFNNLLTVIQGTISLLLYSTPSSDANYQHFVNIEKQAHRGSQLTKQLLGYARKGKYFIKPIHLNDIVMESAETLCRTRKDIRMHYQLAADIHPVEADRYQMEQVFMNLFINAADAMSEGGEITLTTNNIDATDIPGKLRESKTGTYVLLTIEDTGIGMDKKTMDRIFEPFFTTKTINKGTGLGLASVYGIVNSHGGMIDVSSEVGRGTKFSIYLPASDKKISAEIVKQKKALQGKGTILLIDDEKPVLDVASEMLSFIGYTTIKAGSGRQALDIYEQNKDRIDMVILDMIMPDMSGSEVFDHLREMNPHVAVLLASGYSIDGRAIEILNRGCNDFIQKPFTMEDLAEKMKGILKEVD